MLYAAQRTLAGTDAVLSWQALDGNGLARNPGTVTVSVASSAGTALVADQSTSGTGVDPRTYTLAASLIPSPERLTATWKVSGTTVATTNIDVVGGYIASLARIFARFPGLADASKWPIAQVIEARNATEDEFEQACGVAFVPRFEVEVLEGNCDDELLLGRQELRSVTWANYRYEGSTTPVAFTSEQLASIERSGVGKAELTDGTYWPDAIVTLGYVHGHDTPPADLVDAFLIRVNDVLTRQLSSISARATQTVMDGMTTNLAVPGWGSNLTGIPDVDVVLKRYDRRVPGIA